MHRMEKLGETEIMSKILVVDDMPVCMEAITEILRYDGHEVHCASNGEHAIIMLGREPFDLLLLDVMMPGIDGLTVLSILRKDDRWRNLPIILLTDAADKQRVKTAVNLGVQGYLLKAHFSVKDLRARVQKWLVTPASTPPASPTTANEAPQDTMTNKSDKLLSQIEEHLQQKTIAPCLMQVLSLTSNNRGDFKQIAAAIEQHPPFKEKVMELANSIFQDADTNEFELTKMVQQIGSRTFRDMAAILAIDGLVDMTKVGLSPQRFNEHAMATAILAQAIGKSAGIQNLEELFLAGLFHDIGRPILHHLFPEEYQRVASICKERKIDWTAAERNVFGVDHTQMTRVTLSNLNMPKVVIEAAAAHHLPIEELRALKDKDARCALAVHLANRIAHAIVLGENHHSTLNTLHDVGITLGISSVSIGAIARVVASDRTQKAHSAYMNLLYAKSHESLAEEFRRKAQTPMHVAVFSHEAPNDPFSLFCDQLNWLDPYRPNTAILFAESTKDLARRLDELLSFERRSSDGPLDVIIVAPSTVDIPDGITRDRAWRTVNFPTNSASLVQAIYELHTAMAPAAA